MGVRSRTRERRCVMQRWYSPRGARNGFLLATLSAALWSSWATGYLQGASETLSQLIVPSAHPPVQAQCLKRPPSV